MKDNLDIEIEFEEDIKIELENFSLIYNYMTKEWCAESNDEDLYEQVDNFVFEEGQESILLFNRHELTLKDFEEYQTLI